MLTLEHPISSLSVAADVFAQQAAAIGALAGRLDTDFGDVVRLLLNARGHAVICGMGKSGIIGRKIAATLSSTGTPSVFLHPGEAFHGDLGLVTPQDVVLLISYSGETEEVLRLVPSLQRLEVPIIAVTGKPGSTLARNADLTLDVSVEREACPNNLAPTTSTTATLVMGDALAVALMHARGFRSEQFAVFHPGGSLGRRLLTRVRDAMHGELPTNAPDDNIREVIAVMTRGRLGVSIVLDGDKLVGIITDGDLRRGLFSHESFGQLAARDLMTRTPRTVSDGAMLAEAEEAMRAANIGALIAVDEFGRATGILKILDAAS